jgi:hypothetical protein
LIDIDKIIAIITAIVLAIAGAAGGDLATAERGRQVQVVAPPTTVPTPTTTIEPARYHHPVEDVDRWYESAIAAGWSEADWPRLACVIHRESRGNPAAHNPRYPDDSYGLIQLNMRAHRKWVGPLVGGDFNRLFNGYTNLSIGRTLFDKAVGYYGNGWRPWFASNGSCPS